MGGGEIRLLPLQIGHRVDDGSLCLCAGYFASTEARVLVSNNTTGHRGRDPAAKVAAGPTSIPPLPSPGMPEGVELTACQCCGATSGQCIWAQQQLRW